MADSTPPQIKQDWNEEDYKAALAHLEQLQGQIDSLRCTIPSVISPLTRPNKGKAQMFATVQGSAKQAAGNLISFRETWKSEQTQEILSRSKASYDKDSDLRKAQNVVKYGWSNQ